MATTLTNKVEMQGKNGDVITLEEFDDETVVLTHADSDGNVLARTCKGRCGSRTVGPISCPAGKNPRINCGARPPTITCV